MNDLTKVGPEDGEYGWLVEAADTDTSMDSVKEHRTLPRVVIIQSNHKRDLKEKFGGDGVAFLSPGDGVLCDKNTYFDFVPLFKWNQWITWADRNDPNNLIFDSSLDPNSDIAIKSAAPETWQEEYEGGFKKTHTKHLQFGGVVYGDHTLAGTMCVIGFARGEFYHGDNWPNAMFMRKIQGRQMPMWSQIWRMKISERDRKGYQWWGLDYIDGPDLYIKQEEGPTFKTMHEEIKKDYEAKRLDTDFSEASAHAGDPSEPEGDGVVNEGDEM